MQIAYCIGVAEPVSVLVSSLGTSDIPDEVLTKAVREVFDLRPYPSRSASICFAPSTRRPPATATSAANSQFTWEHTDAAADLRTAAKV